MSVNNQVSLNNYNLTPRAKKAFKDAQKLAKERGDNIVNNIHVFYGCLCNSSGTLKGVLADNNIDIKYFDVEEILLAASQDHQDKFYSNKNSDAWHSELTSVLKQANAISDELDQYYIGIEHLFMGIIYTSDYILKYLEIFNVDIAKLESDLKSLITGDGQIETNSDTENTNSHFLKAQDIEKSLETLSKFGVNLNQLALAGELQPVFGREKEIESLIEVLSKKNKSNAILIGEAGVGKTAIVEGLALKICQADVPSSILPYEIYSIDLGRMVAGTKYRGDFEKKFQTLLEIARENPFIILFFDEIHNMFGAGNSDGVLDASNMLKPALARGEIKCIGATTISEYQKIFEKDSAMKRRFEAIDIDEPTKEQTYEIIKRSVESYEQFHNVHFSDSILSYILDCCEKFMTHKRFPDKAFDIVDQIGAKVKIRNLKPTTELVHKHNQILDYLSQEGADPQEVEKKIQEYLGVVKAFRDVSEAKSTKIKKSDVNIIIAQHSKMSVEEIQNNCAQFDKFYKNISQDVFGQEENLQKINDILSCSKIGLNDSNKPLASFIFAGPTSVGKTYTAKKIAKYFYGNEKAFIQINMSELQDETGISKLIGANAGFIGYEQGGFLTNFVMNNPNCVVLFDEIEKSNPKILNLLLHLLDEGCLMDNVNRRIDFSKSIVVLTSNIGSEEGNKKSMGFVQDDTPKEKTFKTTIKGRLKPELLARINDVIVFNDLGDVSLLKIIESEINAFRSKLQNQKIKLKNSKTFYSEILNLIKKENIHAREIKDLLKQKVIIPTARFVVANPKKSEISIKVLDSNIKIQ